MNNLEFSNLIHGIIQTKFPKLENRLEIIIESRANNDLSISRRASIWRCTTSGNSVCVSSCPEAPVYLLAHPSRRLSSSSRFPILGLERAATDRGQMRHAAVAFPPRF